MVGRPLHGRALGGLSLSGGGSRIGGVLVPYEFVNQEAEDLVARFSAEPGDTRKKLIDTLVGDLKTAGVWAKLDALYVMAAHTSQAALLNWKADQYNLTVSSAPVFTADRGYQGDGVDDVLLTGFNPSTAAGAFTQNSGHLGMWSRTNLANGAAQGYEIGNTNSYLARAVNGTVRGRPNHGVELLFGASGLLPGHFMFSRTAAAVWESYINGADVGGGTDASAALTSADFRILSVTAALFSRNQFAVAHWGSGLSAGEVSATYSAIRTYLISVGAA